MSKKTHNPKHTGPDDELDAYLDGTSDISSAYQDQEQAEPSADLDKVILRAAQDELEGKAKRDRAAFWQQWLRPLSAVAAMGFCVVVVLRVIDNTPVLPEEALIYSSNEVARPESTLKLKSETSSGLMADEQAEVQLDYQDNFVSEPPPEPKLELDMASPSRQSAFMRNNEQEELTVTAQKRTQSLQEIPMSVPAPVLEEITLARVASEAANKELADDALAAWQAGAKPAADVWLAGIEASRDNMDAATIAAETARLRRAYPAAAEQDSVSSDDAVSDIASPWAWSAGIAYLEDQDELERAAQEAEKFLQIYPDR